MESRLLGVLAFGQESFVFGLNTIWVVNKRPHIILLLQVIRDF